MHTYYTFICACIYLNRLIDYIENGKIRQHKRQINNFIGMSEVSRVAVQWTTAVNHRSLSAAWISLQSFAPHTSTVANRSTLSILNDTSLWTPWCCDRIIVVGSLLLYTYLCMYIRMLLRIWNRKLYTFPQH